MPIHIDEYGYVPRRTAEQNDADLRERIRSRIMKVVPTQMPIDNNANEDKREDDRFRITLARMVGEIVQALPEMNRPQLRFLTDGLRTLFAEAGRIR